MNDILYIILNNKKSSNLTNSSKLGEEVQKSLPTPKKNHTYTRMMSKYNSQHIAS